MFLIRSRSKNRQAVAPCPATAAPSTSNSISLRLSTSHSASSSLPAHRPSVTPLYQLPTTTDGWVCDPAISALHFSYALTQAAEEDEADTDRCALQSPRPNHTPPCDSPVSFLSLDGSTSPAQKSTAITAATVPTKYRRVSDHAHHTDTQRDNIEPKPSPSSHITKASTGSSSPGGVASGSNGGSGSRKHDW